MSAQPGGRTQRPFLQVPEVAALFFVAEETVRVWARKGKLRSRKTPGGRILVFPRPEVEALYKATFAPEDDPTHDEGRAGDSSTNSPETSSQTGQSSEGTTS